MTRSAGSLTLSELRSQVRRNTASMLISLFLGMLIKGRCAGFRLASTGHSTYLLGPHGEEHQIRYFKPEIHQAIIDMLKITAGFVGADLVRKIHVGVGVLIYPFRIQVDKTMDGESVLVTPIRED